MAYKDKEKERIWRKNYQKSEIYRKKKIKYDKEYYNRSDIQEKQKEYHHQYYLNNKYKIQKRNKDWYNKNKLRVSNYTKKWYINNKDRKNHTSSVWSKRNRILKNLAWARRKERENNCIHAYTNDEWILKCAATNGICPSCNKPFDNDIHKLTLDHIFSIYWANEYYKLTGEKWIYTIDRIQPLCKSCNSSKSNIITFSKLEANNMNEIILNNQKEVKNGKIILSQV